MIEPLPLGTPFHDIDPATHSLTGWPKSAACYNDPAHEAVLIVATRKSAKYECRGTPSERPPRSAYSRDRCPNHTWREYR